MIHTPYKTVTLNNLSLAFFNVICLYICLCIFKHCLPTSSRIYNNNTLFSNMGDWQWSGQILTKVIRIKQEKKTKPGKGNVFPRILLNSCI